MNAECIVEPKRAPFEVPITAERHAELKALVESVKAAIRAPEGCNRREIELY